MRLCAKRSGAFAFRRFDNIGCVFQILLPQAQPLRSGLSVSNQTTRLATLAFLASNRNVGLSTK